MQRVVPPFKPAWWLPGPHLQTLWQSLFRHRPQPSVQRERLDTPDGDFLDLDWHGPAHGPVVLLLHGLSGSARSPYIRGLQCALAARGWRTAALNFRGCSGQPNRTWRAYHSGETGDLHHVYHHLRRQHPAAPLAVVGFSLGGNVLLKWLGEQVDGVQPLAAVAVSAPLRLELCATRLNQGISRLYRNQLLRELKAFVRWKTAALHKAGLPDEAARLEALGDLGPIRTFEGYDGRVVAGLYGFRDAADYYRQSGARPFLRHITRPTLVLHASDDPFMTPEVVPTASELAPSVRLEVSPSGGHVGFIGGRWPWRPEYWLEQRIPAFLEQALAAAGAAQS